MAQLVVYNLQEDVSERLQLRARRHRQSTEEEVREILRNAVKDESAQREPLGSRTKTLRPHPARGRAARAGQRARGAGDPSRRRVAGQEPAVSRRPRD
jgi:plasmid stability protein